MIKQLPSHADLLQWLNYDPASGILRWRLRADRSPQWNGKWAGQPAGGPSKSNGHHVLSLCGKPVLAHRVIWKMSYGVDAPNDIDHRDGDPLNNRLTNLRLATKHQNLRNSKLHRGKNLPKGVSWHHGAGRYRASIYLSGKCKHLGLFDTPVGAHEAYKRAAGAAFGEFARFQ